MDLDYRIKFNLWWSHRGNYGIECVLLWSKPEDPVFYEEEELEDFFYQSEGAIQKYYNMVQVYLLLILFLKKTHDHAIDFLDYVNLFLKRNIILKIFMIINDWILLLIYDTSFGWSRRWNLLKSVGDDDEYDITWYLNLTELPGEKHGIYTW